MGTFLRSRHGIDYEPGFVQGAGRILLAPAGTDWPVDLTDIIVLATGATQYDPVDPWFEVGFTKTGINVTRNNAEETFDVDQVQADIKRRPSNWEMSVGTQLAEGSLETFDVAWELGEITDVTVTGGTNERHVGLSAPTAYREQLCAVLFQFESGLIRAWVFRRCIRAAQESGFTLQKTGEQVSLPTRFNALADSEAPVASQFGEIFEQEVTP
jgi:hypothetical protein